MPKRLRSDLDPLPSEVIAETVKPIEVSDGPAPHALEE